MKAPILHTPRLTLRAFVETDVDALVGAARDEQVYRWTMTPEPFERQHAEDFITRRYPAGWREETVYMFGIFTRDAGRFVGTLGVPVREPGVFEVGCWVARDHRRGGYATEALSEALDWAFTQLRAQRVEWRALTGNEASMRLAEALGFRHEGVLRGAANQRGVYRDVWLAGLLAADARRRRPDRA
jgi:RimJ/RimL family protein N-acetyltransferase